MLCAFISRKALENLRSFFSTNEGDRSEPLDNLCLVSTEIFDAVKEGEIYFSVQSLSKSSDKTRAQSVRCLTPNSYRTGVRMLTYFTVHYR